MKMRDILWEACHAKIGIEITSSDLEALKRKFYSERAKAREEGIFEFDKLQLITAPQTGYYWIVKGEPNE